MIKKVKTKIVIIGTGGTIAGRAKVSSDLSYNAAELTVDELALSVPGLDELADIVLCDLFSLNSKDMGPIEWIKLALTVKEYAENADISGIVVTHGTDTLEEAALFLELTLNTPKPVVITGSMRASTALSADGPSNIYQAVQVSTEASASERGVLVVFNGEIYAGWRIMKAHSLNTGAFGSVISPGYLIGNVYPGHTSFFVPKGFVWHRGFFSSVLTNNSKLPDVVIHYVTAGGSENILSGLQTDSFAGLVLAAFGSGEIPEVLMPKLIEFAKKGLPIVVSSRVQNAVVLPETMTLEESETVIASRHLNPQKSALLLSLILATENSPADIFFRIDLME
ncbi:MAG: L-asparaginase [Acidiferrobacteraceae bacterium]|nr:L-asparaginase [Acidiferrobacteraceae bacterium]|tara:strand:- start:39372 stop:40385 length:1014 start_codon:yes stop_codon:yes gene_type:complete